MIEPWEEEFISNSVRVEEYLGGQRFLFRFQYYTNDQDEAELVVERTVTRMNALLRFLASKGVTHRKC